jgi:predicted small integral membrane protein
MAALISDLLLRKINILRRNCIGEGDAHGGHPRGAGAVRALDRGVRGRLVALNNVVDYGTNLRFVRHVFTMDTTFPDSRLRRRAIRSPLVHHLAYLAIIAAEALTAGLCLWGAVLLLGNLGLPADAFHEAKTAAFAGLGLGFAIWFGGFMVAGGQWFASWQSREWNGRDAAFMFYTPVALVFLILLHET